MILELVPTYEVGQLDLAAQPPPLNLVPPYDPIDLVMTEALRGLTGYGLLGVAVVAPGDPIDLSLPVGVYLVTLTASQDLVFINGSSALNRKRLLVDVTQGLGGGFALTPDVASVDMSSDLGGAFLLSAAEGVTDALFFMYRHERGKCQYMAIIHGE